MHVSEFCHSIAPVTLFLNFGGRFLFLVVIWNATIERVGV